MNKIQIGQTLYYSPRTGFVIPVRVHTIDYLYYKEGSKSLWVEETEEGFHFYNPEDESRLKEFELVNQFFWIDVPVGHAVTPYFDLLWTSLADALRECGGVTKREAKRRHKKVISSLRRTRNFIVGTGNLEAKNLPLLGNRPVYVTRRVR